MNAPMPIPDSQVNYSASKVKISQAVRLVTLAIRAKKVAMIEGSPAIGKSAIVRQIAKQHNLKLIDLRLSQCDPTDLLGFPHIANGKASYIPMDTFPLATDPLPVDRDADGKVIHEYDGWLLFLDEITSAPRGVQAAAYKLILDHMVGNHPLHPRCAIVGAGNKETDGAIVEEMSTALQSRLIHMELIVDHKEWTDWASAAQFDHRIVDFIGFEPGKLYTFKPDHTDKTYAAPRTWEFTNDFLKLIDVTEPDALPLLSGTITEGVAREFILYCDIYTKLPKMNDIIMAPNNVRVPDEPSILFALSGSIAANVAPATIDPLVQYVRRLPMEFQIICMRQMIKRNKSLLGHVAMQKMLENYAVNLFD